MIVKLNKDSFDVLRHQLLGIDGEIQLLEAINSLVLSHGVEAVHLIGKRFDCGSVNGYLEAIIYKAKEECII